MDTSSHDSIWASVPSCPDHGDGYRFSGIEEWQACQHCQDEDTARRAVVDQMQAEVVDRVSGLSQGGVNMPVTVSLAVRLETLIDYFYTGPARTVFEGEFQRRLLNEVKDAQRTHLGGIVTPDHTLHVVRDHKKRP